MKYTFPTRLQGTLPHEALGPHRRSRQGGEPPPVHVRPGLGRRVVLRARDQAISAARVVPLAFDPLQPHPLQARGRAQPR